MEKNQTQDLPDAFEKMDRMYRHQRYFYDLTRKYYLLGRDLLLQKMVISEGDNVLEAGCGTARNLIILAQKYKNTNFYGLDASAEMLKTAQKNVGKKKLGNICLKTTLADNFTFDGTFALKEKFDVIFFSYSVSIIPSWRESLENALENLKNGKSLYIVDFYHQRDLPAWFRKILQGWLTRFDVKYPENLIPFLQSLEKNGAGKLSFKALYKSYSLIAEFRKN
jgi:S-adenosylmethionine-diacylgycerolhomoserine-N-methlytransferase